MFRSSLIRIGCHTNIISLNRAVNHSNFVFQPKPYSPISILSARCLSSAANLRKNNSESESQQPTHKAKTTQPAVPRKTSLRRVAVEAERSRASIKRESIKTVKLDRDADAKVVTAYCAAEQYSIAAVAKTLEHAGYALDPCRTGLYPQVVHFQISSPPIEQDARNAGDVFIFPSGTVVAWDVDEDIVTNLISKKLPPTAENSHLDRMETEDLEFTENPDSDTSSIVGDKINLGLGPAADPSQQPPQSAEQHATDLVLVKTAFSSGLARSVKLAVLETSLESYFHSTRSIPTLLSRGSRLPFTRSFILRKTGELLNARAQLNLNSELTDSLPDMFWDSRHELGLEGYFDHVGRALDVNVRSRVLNQKMDYAHQIVSVLREQLSERHGLMLEWLIIILISFEVAFGFFHLWRHRKERLDPTSTESLVRRFLEKELGES